MTNIDQPLTIIQPLLQQFVVFLANLLLAIIVFIIGYFISVGIGKLITEILKSVKFNKLFEKEGWSKALQRAKIEVNASEFIGAIFKWIFVIISLLVAVDILKLTAFAGLLTSVLNYLPKVIVAALIFVVAVIISDIVEKIVRVTVERMKVGYGYLVASIVKWAIWVFVIFLILDQLLPTSNLVMTLYTGIVYGVVGTVVLGVGLAIGLGGKDIAAGILEDLRRKIKEK
jgi:hypothetical protein